MPELAGAGHARSGIQIAEILAAGMLALAGCLARLTGLGRQSYWSDEFFTVNQTDDSLAHLWQVGRPEVHTPLFALMEHLWILPGSAQPGWTRLLPALLGCAGLAVLWHGLRDSAFSLSARLLSVALLSVSGMALVHSQDVRSYSALLLGATGVTATTLALACPRRSASIPRLLRRWFLWALFASTIHLFGALLVLATAALLIASRAVVPRRLFVLGGLALLPQVLWLVSGLLLTDGFAAGAVFPTPTLRDAQELLAALLGAGTPRAAFDGFHFDEPYLLTPMIILVGWLALVPPRRRQEDALPPEPVSVTGSAADEDDEAAADAAGLHWAGVLSTGFVAATWLGSQLLHLWTLRNMVTIAPAALCAIALLLTHLSRASVLRRRLTPLVTMFVLAVALVISARGFTTPYKSQMGAAADLVDQVRSQDPKALIVGSVSPTWWLASHDPAKAKDPNAAQPMAMMDRYQFPRGVRPRSGTTIYLLYLGVGVDTSAPSTFLVKSLGDQAVCQPAHLLDVIAVVCRGR